MVFAFAGDSTITSDFGTSLPHCRAQGGARGRPVWPRRSRRATRIRPGRGQSKVTGRVQSRHRRRWASTPSSIFNSHQPVRRSRGVVHRLRRDRAAARLLLSRRLAAVHRRGPRRSGQARSSGCCCPARSSPRRSAARSATSSARASDRALFRRPDSRFFKQEYVERTHDVLRASRPEGGRPRPVRAGRADVHAGDGGRRAR